MNTKVIFVGDIVEENGKTLKENNLAIEHTIPINALVEIVNSKEYGGIRLFVVHYSRDCDGTPLYELSFEKDAYKRYEELKLETEDYESTSAFERELSNRLMQRHIGKLFGPFGGDSLKVIYSY